MEKQSIKGYLQKMLDRWNEYDELDGFVAENFRTDLEKTLEYWDLRIADNKEELDKAREEGRREGERKLYRSISKELYKLYGDIDYLGDLRDEVYNLSSKYEKLSKLNKE